MRLSEAIRLGAMLKPQAFGGLEAKRSRGGILGLSEEVIATCALGAAFQAAGCQEGDGSGVALPTRPGASGRPIIVPAEWWPTLVLVAACPVCEEVRGVQMCISHLNDHHRWTREQIADWVATVEPQQASAGVRVTADVAEANAERL